MKQSQTPEINILNTFIWYILKWNNEFIYKSNHLQLNSAYESLII